MARKKRAWNMSNPLYRYLNSRKKSKSGRKSKRGGTMARRRSGRRSGGFGIPTMGKGLVGSLLMGMGAAAVAKRFVGAPLGSFTGAAAGGLAAPNKLAGAAGGWLHDNLGNVGGSSSSGQTVY